MNSNYHSYKTLNKTNNSSNDSSCKVNNFILRGLSTVTLNTFPFSLTHPSNSFHNIYTFAF